MPELLKNLKDMLFRDDDASETDHAAEFARASAIVDWSRQEPYERLLMSYLTKGIDEQVKMANPSEVIATVARQNAFKEIRSYLTTAVRRAEQTTGIRSRDV